RSSSQMETPASDSWARGSLMVSASCIGWVAPAVAVRCSVGRRSNVRRLPRCSLVRRGAGQKLSWSDAVAGGAQAVLGGTRDGFPAAPELWELPGEVGRVAVVLERHAPAVVADDLAPALGDAGLDGDPGLHRGRDDGLAVRRLLGVEPLAAGHRHHPGADPL